MFLKIIRIYLKQEQRRLLSLKYIGWECWRGRRRISSRRQGTDKNGLLGLILQFVPRNIGHRIVFIMSFDWLLIEYSDTWEGGGHSAKSQQYLFRTRLSEQNTARTKQNPSKRLLKKLLLIIDFKRKKIKKEKGAGIGYILL